jgi:hypothetical protein
VSGGLNITEIASRTRHDRRHLRVVLLSELELGRVEKDDRGCYRLVPDSFDAQVLLALRRLERPVTSRTGRPEGEPRVRVHAPPRALGERSPAK